MSSKTPQTPADFIGPHGTVNRRYALQRIGTGDYLMLSNDGKALWRLFSQRDGASFGLENHKGDFTVWTAARWTRDTLPNFNTADARDGYGDKDRESRWWTEVTTYKDTRQAAIDYALRYQPAPFPEKPRSPTALQDGIAKMIATGDSRPRKRGAARRPEGDAT